MKKKGAVSNKNTCAICRYKNRLYSNYCYKCGHKFTEEEKDYASNHSLYSCLNKINILLKDTLIKKISKNVIVRFIVMALFIFLAIISFDINGNVVRLKDNYKYELNYSEYYDEYYVMVDKDANYIDLNLYIPKDCTKIKVEHYDELNLIISEKEFKLTDPVRLNPTNKDYYLLNATYKDKTKSYIKINIRNKE